MINWFLVADSNELIHSETPTYQNPVRIGNDRVDIYISNSVNMGQILQTTAVAHFRGKSLEVPLQETLIIHRDKDFALMRDGTQIMLGIQQ